MYSMTCGGRAYAPLMLALPQSAAVALLRRQLPQGQHFPPGFPQRCVYEGIERWAQRWNLNTSWIREQAWRTLSFWAANPKLIMGTPGPVHRPCGPRCGASRSGQRAGPALGACDQHGFEARTPYQPKGVASTRPREIRLVRSAPCMPPAHAAQATRRRGGGHESKRQRRYRTRRGESCSQDARSPRSAARPTSEEALAGSSNRPRWSRWS